MAAVQVDVTSGVLLAANSNARRKVKVENLGPNAIYVEIGAAAVVATSYKIAAGAADSFDLPPGQAINAIAATAIQVTPADTRVEVV